MSTRLPLTLLQHRLDVWSVTRKSHFCEHEDLDAWLLQMQGAFQELRVPEAQWVDSAMYLLRGRLKDDMAAREEQSVECGEPEWDWTIFERTLRRAREQRNVAAQLECWEAEARPVFRPSLNADFEGWVERTEVILRERGIPESSFADACLTLIPATLQEDMRITLAASLRSVPPDWTALRAELSDAYEKSSRVMLQRTLDGWRTSHRATFDVMASGLPRKGVNLADWLRDFERECEELDLPRNLWVDAALGIFGNGIKQKLGKRSGWRETATRLPWDKFKEEVTGEDLSPKTRLMLTTLLIDATKPVVTVSEMTWMVRKDDVNSNAFETLSAASRVFAKDGIWAVASMLIGNKRATETAETGRKPHRLTTM